MEQKNTPPSESFQIRCPRLGHQIYFSYCRQENMGTPCAKTLDCWHPYFDVVAYLRGVLTADAWRDAFERPAKSKLCSIMEIIAKVQKK